jgi:ribonuclease R
VSAGELVLVQLGGGGGGRGGDGGRGARGGEGRARVLRRIGRPDVARDAIEALMLERGLARGFEPEVCEAAERAREQGLAVALREVGEGRRRDLRDLATLTIDPASAQDFDDAISAQRLKPGGDASRRGGGGQEARSGGSDRDAMSAAGVEGGVRVWVHIADVSAYVKEGSVVDREARARGTSVYVPGAVEPMLPHALSNDACSLVPGAERAAVSVELDLRGAEVVRCAFYRSLIRSDARLDYERVDRVFAGVERAQEPWAPVLALAREASAALGRARERAGGLVIDSEEPEVVFDEEGNVREIQTRAQTESHRLIEHLMIAANEAVARRLSERGVGCLYRVHERPEPARVLRLVEQLASLGVATPAVPETISPSQAAELMGEISQRVERHVQAALKRAGSGRGGRPASDGAAAAAAAAARAGARAGPGDARVSPWGGRIGPWGGRIALSSLVLRSLRQAYYSPRNIGHAGLHSACYCHFTSPIRRYPDLVCHRALVSTLGGEEAAPRARELGELGEWTSEREREAMKIERDGDDLARCFALEQALYEGGWEQTFTGEVTGLISAGAFVAFGGAGSEAGGPFDGAGLEAGGATGGARPEGGGAGGGPDGDAGSKAGDPGSEAGAVGAPPGPLYEGMLPVRRMRSGEGRDWWELNEHETILRGERSGMTLRLGDPIEVRVARVDTVRGRVDLTWAVEAV